MPTTLYTSPAIADFDMAGIDAVCRKWGVRKLSLFGSFLRSEQRPESDVDLLYEMEPGRRFSFITLFQFEQELASFLAGRKPDLGTADTLHEFIRDEILAETRVIYEAV